MAVNCHGEIIRTNGGLPTRYYDCTSRAKWRVEWLSKAKASGPVMLHQQRACSAHLVQLLNEGTELAIGGDVHVLPLASETEWWAE